MRARRQRQAAVDAAGGSLWSLVMSQLSDPTTTALLHDLVAAAGITLADASAGDHGPVPRAEFAPGDALDDDAKSAREAWRKVADETSHVLGLATRAADEEASRREMQERYEYLMKVDPRDLSAAAEADRRDEMQELSDALQAEDTDALDGRGADEVLLDSLLVLQQAVASMSSVERQGRPACAPQAMRLYKMLQGLYGRAQALRVATSGM
eukprot:COSAG02_NODE_1554_length_11948_cov_41.539455_2_plen_211_part_00